MAVEMYCDKCGKKMYARRYVSLGICDNYEQNRYDVCESCYSDIMCQFNDRKEVSHSDPDERVVENIQKIYDPYVILKKFKEIPNGSFFLYRGCMYNKLSTYNDIANCTNINNGCAIVLPLHTDVYWITVNGAINKDL